MRASLSIGLAFLLSALTATSAIAADLSTSFRVVSRAGSTSEFECQVRILNPDTNELRGAGSTYVAAGESTVIRVQLAPNQWLHVTATVAYSGKEANFVSELERDGHRSQQRTTQTIPVSASVKQ